MTVGFAHAAGTSLLSPKEGPTPPDELARTLVINARDVELKLTPCGRQDLLPAFKAAVASNLPRYIKKGKLSKVQIQQDLEWEDRFFKNTFGGGPNECGEAIRLAIQTPKHFEELQY
jgi:hypothetical protein